MKLPLLALLLSLFLSACASVGPMNQAEYKGYSYRMVLKDVRDSACRYGPYNTRYPDVLEKRSEEFVGGVIALWDGTVFKNLTCTWKSQDGTVRTESIEMQTLLTPKVVKWDFSDVDVHRTQPFSMNPDIRVELRDKSFRISVQARVQYYGEILPNGGQRIPYRTVTNTLLERTGQ